VRGSLLSSRCSPAAGNLAARAGSVLALAGAPAAPPEAVGHATPEALCDALLLRERPIAMSGNQALLSAVIGALNAALVA
jgi:hypothetical protein